MAFRHMLVAVLALSVVAPAVAARTIWFVCAMDGAVHRERCCAAEEAGSHAELTDPDCCRATSVEAVATTTAPPARSATGEALRGQVAVAIVPAAEATRIASRPVQQLRGPRERTRAVGPPIFIQYCSLLI
jgi:hypothetical protein